MSTQPTIGVGPGVRRTSGDAAGRVVDEADDEPQLPGEDRSSWRGGAPGGAGGGSGRSAIGPVLVVSLDLLALLSALVITSSVTIHGLAYVLTVLVGFALMATYRPRLSLSPAEDLLKIVECLMLSVPAITLVVFSWEALHALVRPMVVAAVLVPVGRDVAYRLIRRLRKGGILTERALVVGAGDVGSTITRILREHLEYGLVPVGVVDADLTPDGSVAPFDLSRLRRVVHELAVRHVVVAFGRVCDADLVGILRGCETLPIKVYVVPRLFELGVTKVGSLVEDLWGFPLVRLKRPTHQRAARRLNRLFDVAVGSLLLVLTAPVFVAAAIAVRLSSPGPVFFRQKRVGDNGRVIEMLKFRTLLRNGDADETWYVGEDERRTCPGRFLRRTGLDELPQLLNVLKGDMTLVGPRPERPYFANRFAMELPRYADRQRVRQGITGWAQVHGLRGDTSVADRLRFDNHYIEHGTIWMDIRILARTVAVVFGRRGA
jgi:exopolysaccharide biosynthesis polyprenyl glycosylphosphotransferase